MTSRPGRARTGRAHHPARCRPRRPGHPRRACDQDRAAAEHRRRDAAGRARPAGQGDQGHGARGRPVSVVPFAFTGAPETWAVGVLRASEWFPRAGPGPRSVSIVDRLVVDGAVLLWVSIGGPPARPVLLAARRDGARLELTSTAAGIVHWSGLPGPARFIGQVRATATNDVARIALGGRDALLKAYRVVGDGQAEEQAL